MPQTFSQPKSNLAEITIRKKYIPHTTAARKLSAREKVEQIYKILTSREMKRGSPNREDEIKKRIFEAVRMKRPLRLVGLWGAMKESQSKLADAADAATLARLKEVKMSVEGIAGPGSIEVKIVMCDVHHKLCNGLNDRDFWSYQYSLSTAASERGIVTERLSDHYYGVDRTLTGWQKFQSMISNLTSKFTLEDYEYYSEADSNIYQTYDQKIQMPELRHLVDYSGIDELYKDKKLYEMLERMALKHSSLYDKGMPRSKIVDQYIGIERFFIRRLNKSHQDAIFFSYSSPEIQRILFGEVPAVFFSSMKRGITDCPWFLDLKENHVALKGAYRAVQEAKQARTEVNVFNETRWFGDTLNYFKTFNKRRMKRWLMQAPLSMLLVGVGGCFASLPHMPNRTVHETMNDRNVPQILASSSAYYKDSQRIVKESKDSLELLIRLHRFARKTALEEQKDRVGDIPWEIEWKRGGMTSRILRKTATAIFTSMMRDIERIDKSKSSVISPGSIDLKFKGRKHDNIPVIFALPNIKYVPLKAVFNERSPLVVIDVGKKKGVGVNLSDYPWISGVFGYRVDINPFELYHTFKVYSGNIPHLEVVKINIKPGELPTVSNGALPRHDVLPLMITKNRLSMAWRGHTYNGHVYYPFGVLNIY